jgi:hypothetical protein
MQLAESQDEKEKDMKRYEKIWGQIFILDS